ncbi:hypothetical protein [Comamonas suwonensis]|uniref:Uncharacterized protein n=1 Tax=Comamonas suwonensis TaxID=2606214 RepID=A0A843B895_9BURK|nr:hypothetical protein [Comamonas suwonensis]MBI1627073.1 hypothetical protein [Comamonas suwonensis]
MNDFWNKANLSFSGQDRSDYNSWRNDLYELAEKLRDATHGLPEDDPRFSNVCKKAEHMFSTISQMPTLER